MKLLLSKDKRFFLVTDINIDEANLLRDHLSHIPHYYWVLKKRYPWKYDGWDGKKYFIDKNMQIPRGLWSEVYAFCKQHNIPLEMTGSSYIRDTNFDFKEFEEFCLGLFKDHEVYTPYDYQIKAAAKIVKNKFNQSEIATSAGKTLISYMIFMWLRKQGFKKQLIIVPRLTLVNQLIEDFNDYANGKYEFTYQEIKGDTDKLKKEVDFVVGTFQSLTKLPKSWFQEFDSLFVDEAHNAKCTSIQKIIIKNDANFRVKYGMTGTVDDGRDIMLSTQSFLGPLIQNITPKFLIDNGYATPIHVKAYYLKYLPYKRCKWLQELRVQKKDTAVETFALEKDIVRDSTDRFYFIVNKVLEVSGNVLVLFSDIKNGYGKRMFEYIKSNTSKRVYYIDGGTKEQIRDYYKKVMEDDDAILVASSGTLSTGVSIKNIAHIFLTESYKSRTVVMQSIGRGMRLLKNKLVTYVYDFIDDFRVESRYKKNVNYVYTHGQVRIEYYKEYYKDAAGGGLDIETVVLGEKSKSAKNAKKSKPSKPNQSLF